jgi:multiple sugar transport system permease protein
MPATDAFAGYLERRSGQTDAFNLSMANEVQFAAFHDVVFPVEPPATPKWRELWASYVAKRFPLLMLRVEGDFTEPYRQFLANQHKNYDKRVADYNAENNANLPGLANVVYTPTMPEDDLNFLDWAMFTDTVVPVDAKRLITVEGLYRDHLKKKYETPQAAGKAHGLAWTSWDNVMPPRAETDLLTFERHRDDIRKEFLWRNYAFVLNYMLFHGNAAFNTFVLVLLTVLGQLTVQPLAAYGLSRFRLRYSHKVLLFLLATMAFPAEVAMIPNFLMIKQLGLLNTYWALVLPGLASGMGIFLLKGYFDSLPKELYEAAMMDGASEFRMFFQITLPLSMPILAVIALGSFAAAYGGFMWAFLICQKPSMWTLMVFLWQLGRESYQSVWMASLVIAAIPTLLVFIFCQRIILRGIIVPTMK